MTRRPCYCIAGNCRLGQLGPDVDCARFPVPNASDIAPVGLYLGQWLVMMECARFTGDIVRYQTIADALASLEVTSEIFTAHTHGTFLWPDWEQSPDCNAPVLIDLPIDQHPLYLALYTAAFSPTFGAILGVPLSA